MSTFIQTAENITPEIYLNLKQALELGKWADGRKLTPEQKETCMQAVIAWEIWIGRPYRLLTVPRRLWSL